ncbi:unnamed protein product [Microthlaspi erraticum]|uniref:Reverse transcriptase zinc-binding domain-containing protein n=1 Tax=Microthlaspi erraticum TaxID=1685480 RepID=A0A6D2IDA8_9BRAS|nr:unnamed protein product [Microthlaspi erraticum]
MDSGQSSVNAGQLVLLVNTQLKGEKQWIHRSLIHKGSFWSVKETQSGGSWMWRKILKYRDLAKPFHRVEVFDGETISFWFDYWSPLGRLYEITGPRGYIDLELQSDATVASALTRNRRRHWIENLNKIEEEVQKIVRVGRSGADAALYHIWRELNCRRHEEAASPTTRLLKLIDKNILIGNGEDTFFWWDPWTPFGPLIHYIGCDGPTSMGIPLFSTVSDLCDQTVWIIDGVTQDSFSSRQVWNCIRETKAEVSWAQLLWHKARTPKHAFSAWLFVLNRNPTLDRVTSWGCDVEQTCLLCGTSDESRDHLFFACPFSLQVWQEVLLKLSISSPPSQWDAVLQWLPVASLNRDRSLAVLQAWQTCLYEIWAERNRRYHLGVTFPARKIICLVFSVVHDRALSLALQNPSRQNLLSCWS